MGDREPNGPGCNVVLERLLARAGWSPESLGDHINRLATTLRLKVHIHRRYPRRWVYAEKNRATPRIPRDPLPSLVCLLLYQRLGEPVTPPMLGWPVARGVLYVPADDGLHQSWDGAGAIAALGEVVDADSMERRHVMTMTGLTLTAVDHDPRDAVRLAESVLSGTRELTPAVEASVHAHLAGAAARAREQTIAARGAGPDVRAHRDGGPGRRTALHLLVVRR